MLLLIVPGPRRVSEQNRVRFVMIDLLIQVGYVFLVLVILLFVCTIPIWLIVLVVVLVLR
jgi:hypothetical protein